VSLGEIVATGSKKNGSGDGLPFLAPPACVQKVVVLERALQPVLLLKTQSLTAGEVQEDLGTSKEPRVIVGDAINDRFTPGVISTPAH
jgi:hypothetical protein